MLAIPETSVIASTDAGASAPSGGTGQSPAPASGQGGFIRSSWYPARSPIVPGARLAGPRFRLDHMISVGFRSSAQPAFDQRPTGRQTRHLGRRLWTAAG
jgi:hypothetical protein